MFQSQLTLFKILKFSGPSLPGMTSSTLQPHFLSGGLLWQMVIVISLARERKTAPIVYAPGLRPEWFKAQPNWMIKYNWRKMINIKILLLNYITMWETSYVYSPQESPQSSHQCRSVSRLIVKNKSINHLDYNKVNLIARLEFERTYYDVTN